MANTPASPLYAATAENATEDDSTAAPDAFLYPQDDSDPSANLPDLSADADEDLDPKQAKEPLPMQKRRRVTRACDECRRKKIKCDGKQPCTHCTVYSYGRIPLPSLPPSTFRLWGERGRNCSLVSASYLLTQSPYIECTYDQPSNRRRNPAPQYVEALENRLHKAEALLRVVLPDINLDDPRFDVHATQQMLATAKREKLPHQPHQPQEPAPQLQSSQPPPASNGPRPAGAAAGPADAAPENPGCEESLLESMVDNSGFLDLDDQGHWDYHGHTSGVIFIRRLRKQLGAADISAPSLRSRSITQQMFDSPKSASESPQDATLPPTHDLPTRDVARRLCHNALEDGCSLMRFVHEPSFFATFDRIYDTPPEQYSNEENSFLPLLYIVMSVGCLFSDDRAGPLDLSGYESAIGQGYVALNGPMDLSWIPVH